MNLFGVITAAIEPITELIDNLSTSDEEKLLIKQNMFEMQSKLYSSTLEYEKSVLQAKADIVKAEAQGQGWMQRSWRPITMLTFLVLVVCDSFGLLEFRLTEQAWTLLQIGLGGYVVGRSAEKIAPTIRDAMRKDPQI